jgi:hypothetical protein
MASHLTPITPLPVGLLKVEPFVGLVLHFTFT